MANARAIARQELLKLREQLDRQIAELDDAETAAAAKPPAKARRRRAVPGSTPEPPGPPADEVAIQRMRRVLRDRGYR